MKKRTGKWVNESYRDWNAYYESAWAEWMAANSQRLVDEVHQSCIKAENEMKVDALLREVLGPNTYEIEKAV